MFLSELDETVAFAFHSQIFSVAGVSGLLVSVTEESHLSRFVLVQWENRLLCSGFGCPDHSPLDDQFIQAHIDGLSHGGGADVFVSFATEAVDSLGEDLTSLFATGHFHTEVGAVVPADDVLASVLLAQMEFVQSDNVITSGDLLQPLLDTLEMFEKQPGFLPTNITEHFANEFDQRETFALFLDGLIETVTLGLSVLLTKVKEVVLSKFEDGEGGGLERWILNDVFIPKFNHRL